MRKNSLKRIFASLAMTAVATASVAAVPAFAEGEESTTDPNAAEETTAEETTAEETTEEESFGIGPQADGSYRFIDGTVLTEAEIAASEGKPVISVPTIEVNEKEAAGKKVAVTLSVSGTTPWASSGIHLFYDEKLTLDVKSNGKVNYEEGVAVADLEQKLVKENEADLAKGVFFTSGATADYGTNGAMYTVYFTLPADAKAGDVYGLNLTYVENDCFTNQAKDKAMEAYAFTHLVSGAIKVVGEATAAPTTAATTAAPTTAAPTTTAPKNDAPHTGVAGVGAAVAGLAVAAGAAFVLRKKED